MNPAVRISTVEHRPQNAEDQQQQADDDAEQHTLLVDIAGAQLQAVQPAHVAGDEPFGRLAASARPVLPVAPTPLPTILRQYSSNRGAAGGGKLGTTAAASFKSKRVFKVIIIGDAGVGKTCLSYRFCNGRFPGATEATIGVDFRERSVIIEDELIRVQLWDTAGQERYRQSIVAHYYRNVNAVVFVYDVADPKSFASLPAWIAECRKHALTSAGGDTPHILIGNKCDLQQQQVAGGAEAQQQQKQQRRVKTDQAQMFADENDMALFETSALADSEADHVESIFLTLVHKLRQCKPMHVQSSEERTHRDQQKILLKANEVAKLAAEEDEIGGGICC